MKERWLEIAPDADEKQEVQFDTWLSRKDISFSTSKAERDYRERVTLLKDAIQMRKPPQRYDGVKQQGIGKRSENVPSAYIHQSIFHDISCFSLLFRQTSSPD